MSTPRTRELDPFAPDLTLEAMLRIADGLSYVLASRDLALRRDLPLEVQERLAGSGSSSVLFTLAGNPMLHPAVGALLAEHADRGVAYHYATEQVLSVETQERLMQSDDPDMPSWLAQNASLTPENQRRVLHGPDEKVPYFLAHNTNLDPDLQRELFERDDVNLRHALRWNPSLVAEIGEELFSPETPVAELLETAGAEQYLRARLEGLDPAAVSALLDDWTGTLGELVTACRALGPEPPSASE